ncbi:MAG: hypothetical protein J6T01_02865 [Kiritimatiellae bacterium]|nr:hypothetical protein [Kiritimatiellia bacterium]
MNGTVSRIKGFIASAAVCAAAHSAFAVRPEVWLFLAPDNAPDKSLVAASVAWMGEASGALVDSYYETYRDGALFAASGSSVISGRHFQDFNYLCAKADVKIVRYGKTALFDSTIANFGLETIAWGETAGEIYGRLLSKRPSLSAAVGGYFTAARVKPKHRCYLYPEVAYRRLLALPEGERAPSGAKVFTWDGPDGENLAAFTSAVAERSAKSAKCVFFGDPAALECRVPAEVRRRSAPLYAPCVWRKPTENLWSGYAESESPLIAKACEMATAFGDRVIYGRQTADGDLFRMSHYGCSIQILDPYRPTFPCVEALTQKWSPAPAAAEDDEPSDEQLRKWAEKGMILTTLLWHSGEVAHNEAMLNVVEFAQMNKFKMGIGVHAQRYETCPQLWELLNVPSSRGGAAEYIEPVLYSGGLGIMAEAKFPPELLKANIAEAKRRIAAVAGESNVPAGYQAFMDSDLRTCLSTNPAVWKAAGEAGMKYFISSSAPGRTRILHEDANIIVINQSYRIVESASPFVRITSDTDVSWGRGSACGGPGWVVGTLDAPVIAFTPYIWEYGNRFRALANRLKTGGWYVNVKPGTIARYARVLSATGKIPAFARGGLTPPGKADGNGR